MVNPAVRLFAVLILLAVVPAGRSQSHVSYALYYGPGDGTVRLVDPSTGQQIAPIFASATNAETVFVHWFAYDWPNNRMYVVYSDNPSGELLLGHTDPHRWHITPVGPIGPLGVHQLADGSYIDYESPYGLAYSHKSQTLIMHAKMGFIGPGRIQIDPANATITALYGLPFAVEGGQGGALTNDLASNVWYSVLADDAHDGSGCAIVESHPDPNGRVGETIDLWNLYVHWIAGLRGGDFPASGGSWNVVYQPVSALAIHPEEATIYSVGVANVFREQSFGILKEFGVEQSGRIWPLRRMDPVIEPNFAPNSGSFPFQAASLVFVPWEG
jgi:hypothetical protein